MLRSATCGDLNLECLGRVETLAGWVSARRDHGGIVFIDLRDRYGLTQVVFNPEKIPADVFLEVSRLKNEDVVMVSGPVVRRPAGMENRRLATGEIELLAGTCRVLNHCAELPFELDGEGPPPAENHRLAYRFLDLRRPAIQRNFILRHRAAREIRRFLDENGYLEIETPLLGRSTPEGARDYLVPSRVEPGRFYALPQSPQTFKQLLMAAGFDRYYQLARCLRDEDLRADRQPEFTQVDIEASFVEPADIRGLIEGMLARVFPALTDFTPGRPFPRMSYDEAVNCYGTDKPDLRFGLAIADYTELFRTSPFEVFRRVIEQGGRVRGIRLPGVEMSGSQLKSWEEKAREAGAKGLVWVRRWDGETSSPAKRFLGPETLDGLGLGGESRGIVFLVADEAARASTVLGRLRTALIGELALEPESRFALLWVENFPLFARDEVENRLVSVHHPFTAPREEDLPGLEKDPLGARSLAYDLVLNGSEVGGGSIRIHRPDTQERVFRILGIPEEKFREEFGFLLAALAHGAPPHGGIAIGFDRLVATLLGLDSIREVIAFPKTQRGSCLLTGAPGKVSERQLRELGLRLEPAE